MEIQNNEEIQSKARDIGTAQSNQGSQIYIGIVVRLDCANISTVVELS